MIFTPLVPVRFYLDVGKVHPVEVGEHLVDLGGVLKDGPGGLGQVVQAGVASQSLSKGTDHSHLRSTSFASHYINMKAFVDNCPG